MLRRAAAPQEGEFVVLLCRATTSAADRGLNGDRPTAAVDGIGSESRRTSRMWNARPIAVGPEEAVKDWQHPQFLAGITFEVNPDGSVTER